MIISLTHSSFRTNNRPVVTWFIGFRVKGFEFVTDARVQGVMLLWT